MKQIPVSELEGPLLAEFVAMVRGWEKRRAEDCCGKLLEIDWVIAGTGIYQYEVSEYRPDINGGQAMELLEELGEKIESMMRFWFGISAEEFLISGNKKLWICRAVVASKFGEYVEVEDAL